MTHFFISILVLLLSFLNTVMVSNTYTNNLEIDYMRRQNLVEISTSENDEPTQQIDDEYIPVITIDRTESIVEYYRYNIDDTEFAEFVRVVEAEVTGDYPFGVSYEEAFKSKLRVAQVILNRVESPHFPDTVHDVIFQKNAFTPLLDGRYWEVDISQVTIDACRAALLASTEDTTFGCEFFSSGTKTCKYGSYVFTDAVGHSFFKSYRQD